MTCNGVCYLKDQIAKTVETETSSDTTIPNVKTLDFFVITDVLNIPNNTNVFIQKNIYIFKSQIIKLIYLDKLINPPI